MWAHRRTRSPLARYSRPSASGSSRPSCSRRSCSQHACSVQSGWRRFEGLANHSAASRDSARLIRSLHRHSSSAQTKPDISVRTLEQQPSRASITRSQLRARSLPRRCIEFQRTCHAAVGCSRLSNGALPLPLALACMHNCTRERVVPLGVLGTRVRSCARALWSSSLCASQIQQS
eukprot:2375576-Pleurochrysis_carterae.AAC.4